MKILSLAVVIFLSSCSTTIPKYTEEQIQNEELAFIKVEKIGFLKLGYRPWIDTIYNSNGDIVASRQVFGNRISKLHLPEGNYLIIVECRDDSIYAFPKLAAQLEKNKSYEISCSIANTKKGLLGLDRITALKAEIKEINTLK